MALNPDRQLLPAPHRLALFRVFQELFNQIASNPRTENLRVQFGMDEGAAVLEITYDSGWPGQSLDWDALAQQGEISLASALGWVEGLGGRTEIQPLAENENKVRVRIPVNG